MVTRTERLQYFITAAAPPFPQTTGKEKAPGTWPDAGNLLGWR